MTEDTPALSESQKPKNWFAKLSSIFHEPTREDFLDTLHEANTKHLIDDSALEMMEGVMQFSRLKACDLMVPRAQMVVLDLSEPRSSWLPELIRAEHSRFPVIMGADKDNVIGILHAKTLLHFLIDENFRAIDHLRPAKFIPESMPLNELLRDFRTERNHMAIIVDEFGGISGLINDQLQRGKRHPSGKRSAHPLRAVRRVLRQEQGHSQCQRRRCDCRAQRRQQRGKSTVFAGEPGTD